jgi:hypothetical protein
MSEPKSELAAKKKLVIDELALEAEKGVPFGHFQLFYDSIERVTERRLGLNRANASLASLIAAGMGVIAAWAYDKEGARQIALLLIFFLSMLAAIFCRWWWRQIEDYKQLNGAKFDVLSHMAKNIVFLGEERGRATFDPFLWEWKLIEAQKALMGWKGRLVLGASWSEMIVPKAFLVFFVFTGFSALYLYGLDRKLF